MSLPTITSKVDEPLLKAFSTVCEKLYAENLTSIPADGMAEEGIAEDFSLALAPFGKCLDGLTNFATLPDQYFPPFVALVVQPNQPIDGSKAPILILAWRGSTTPDDWSFNLKFHPAHWTHGSENIQAHGGYINVVESTLDRFENDIIGLIECHKVERVYFTGHSLGGGVANVAHLIVRARLMTENSLWAGKDLTCLAYTFAAPQTIVRLYEEPPDLILELDASSYNVVYGCDPVPRAPGMPEFLGTISSTWTTYKIASNPLLAKIFVALLAWEVAAAFSSQYGPIKLPSLFCNVISLTVEQAQIMRKFTHLGTVVYKSPDTEEWEHFTTTAVIEKNLNVSGQALSELLASCYRDLNPDRSGSPNKDDLQSALFDAHKYYEKISYST